MNSNRRRLNIKKKKHDKHFAIQINDQKIKIINFRLKEQLENNKSIRILELVSKIKYPVLPDLAEIKIDTDEKSLYFKGEKSFARNKPGNYTQSFRIIEMIETPSK